MNFTNNHRIIFLYSTIFVLISLITVYLPVWLHDVRNLSLEKIGILIGIIGFLKVFSNYFIIKNIKTIKGKKLVIIFISLLIAIIFIINSFFKNPQSWITITSVFFILILFSPILPLVENINVSLNKNFHTSYGKLRISGSISFCLAAIFFGFIVNKYSTNYLPIIFMFSLGFFLWSIFLMPEKDFSQKKVLKSSMVELCKDKDLVLILLSCSIILASHAMYYAFSAIYWKSSNMNLFQVGFLWSWGVLAEIIFFIFIDKIKIKNFFFLAIIFAGFIAMIRWFLTFLFNSFFVLIFIQSLHAFTFGLAHYLVMYYIYTKVEANNKLIAQSFYHALSSGVIMTTFTIVAGFSFKYNNGVGFLLMAAFSFFSIILIFLRGVIIGYGIKK